MEMSRLPWPLLAVCAVLTAAVTLLAEHASALPPVSLTIVSHNEESGDGRPDYTADLGYYLQNRALVKLLAETIISRGATYNFQSDWNYLKAVAMYDVGSVTDDTGGKNIVRWMREDMGVEVDPHAHETQYNYADVAYLIEQLGVAPSKSVGGFLYDPPDNGQGWEQHETGIYGQVYPSYFWRADHLWGAATYLHQGNDDKSSGIWRPKDCYNFYVDDPNRRLLYIGGCDGQDGLVELLNDVEAGTAPADGFYTANLIMIQDFMTEQSIEQLGSFIDSMAPYVAQGRLRWVTLSQMADLWTTEYGSQPFRYDCAAGTPTATPTVTPSPISSPTPPPEVTPSPQITPSPTECLVYLMTPSKTKLRIKRHGSKEVTIMVEGESGCTVVGEMVEAEVVTGKKRISSFLPMKQETDETGQAVFTITAGQKSGKAKVKFSAGNLEETIIVKIKKK